MCDVWNGTDVAGLFLGLKKKRINSQLQQQIMLRNFINNSGQRLREQQIRKAIQIWQIRKVIQICHIRKLVIQMWMFSANPNVDFLCDSHFFFLLFCYVNRGRERGRISVLVTFVNQRFSSMKNWVLNVIFSS